MIENYCINKSTTLMEALKKMDEIGYKLLIVLDDNLFHSLLSIGDVQRALINNKATDSLVEKVLRKQIRIANPNDSLDEVKQMMLTYRMEYCPVVKDDKTIERIYFWKELFEQKDIQTSGSFNCPVVLMAGGFGTRMRPLTYVLPKPLIPIGEKTILQEIFDRFHRYGCDQFHTSVNYKADFIMDFVNKLELPYEVDFFKEDEPLGTAGSLQLLKGKISETFFVHNCDILIDNDYSEILDYHRSNSNEITIVAAMKHFSLAYGTLETGENGELISLSEKPDITFQVNTGMYILEPYVLEDIPENTFLHITDLIEKIKARKGKVGVYPVSEKSWKDIGNWEEYSKHIGLSEK